MDKKKEISTILLYLFLILAVVMGATIYFLSNYYFINIDTEFDVNNSTAQANQIKAKKLKPFDFSLFAGENFKALQRGYWYISNGSDYKVGNSNPFNKTDLPKNNN